MGHQKCRSGAPEGCGEGRHAASIAGTGRLEDSLSWSHGKGEKVPLAGRRGKKKAENL